MKKTLLLGFFAAAVGTASARADIGFDIRIGGHGRHYAPPIYHHAPVVVVEAPPVVYAPPFVVHQHAVMVAPAPVFVPPPVVVYPSGHGHGHRAPVYSHHSYDHAVEHAQQDAHHGHY